MNLMRRDFLKHSVASLAVLPFFTSTRSYAAPMASSKFVDVDGIVVGKIMDGTIVVLFIPHLPHSSAKVEAPDYPMTHDL